METFKQNRTTLFKPTFATNLNNTLLEQKDITNEFALGGPTNQMEHSISNQTADKVNPSTRELFDRPYLIAQGNWSVASAVSTPLYTSTLAAILNSFPSLTTTMLSIHSMFRAGFTFRLQLNSSPFHSGKLAMFYIPPQRGERTGGTFNNTLISGYPFVMADAGNSSVVELHIPYAAVQDFLDTNLSTVSRTSNTLGNLYISPFSQLRIGTGGPTTVGYSLWIIPDDVDMRIPVPNHGVIIQSEDIALPGDIVPEIPSSISRILEGLSRELPLPSTSRSVNENLRSNTPKSNASLKDTSYAGSTPSISNRDGHNTEHLSLVPEETKVDQTFDQITFRNEQDLIKIAQIPQHFSTTQWAFDEGVGTVKFRLPVTPRIRTGIAATTTVNGYTDYTYMSYVSMPFAFWRGSINYRFVIAGTQQHTGRLMAVWIPNDNLEAGISAKYPNLTVQQASLLPNVIFDLAENKEFNVSIPYSSVTPFKNCANVSVPPNGLGDTTMRPDYINGSFYLLVLNPLRGPSTVSNTIDIQLFVSAGSDLQLKGLLSERDGHARGIPYLTDAITIQSEDVVLESSRVGMTNDKVNSVSTGQELVQPDNDQGKKSDNNLNHLLSRYYPQFGYRFTVDGQSNRVLRVAQKPGLIGSSTEDLFPASNLITFFSAIFNFWEGSLNYFFLHNTTVNNPILATFTHNNSYLRTPPTTKYPNSDLLAYADVGVAFSDESVDLSVASRYSHISNLRINASVEVTLPFRNTYRRLLNTTRNIDNLTSAGILEVLYSNPSTTAQQVSMQIFQSIGSDFKFQYLVPPPRLILTP